ncbi:MAG TPA: aspartate kinase [Fimbriimonadaceae bacterium]|nr:aspartate kinase [Fimbriimonadaceae bacterium]HRJ33223.1 aspartate kinase [Fimbriimonadaceae bacterium]
MKVKVLKFGGTSMATPEARRQAAYRVVSSKDQGFSPLVVVSAIGRKGAPYATDTLMGLLKEIDPTVEPDPREMDLMIACGEIFSSVIFAHTLKTLGHSAQAFRGGQAGIRTDGVFGNARILSIHPVSLRRSLMEGHIPVVCGFQGIYVPGDGSPGGELTTLGRGGSDTTAAALGAALRAHSVEIFTDVDGVKTADPDFVPQAPTLRKVSYAEVAEIAHLGAKVLHPRAAEIAMKYSIPLWVKNTFGDDEGTEIVADTEKPDRRFSGVTHTGKLVMFEFSLSEVPVECRRSVEAHVYGVLAENGISLFMINHSASGFGFSVPRSQFPVVSSLLDGFVLPLGDPDRSVAFFQLGDQPSPEARAQARVLGSLGPLASVGIRMMEGCTMVSLIGEEGVRAPGIFLKILETLDSIQVPVLQTADSDLSLSVLVPESETARAVRALHEAFDLEEVR